MKNDGIQIRISDFLYAFFKNRFLIAALTAAGLLIGIILSGVSYLRGEISREYVITESFAINTRVDNGRYSSGSATPMKDDMYLAEDLVDSVMYVMQSEKVLNSAINTLRLTDVTPGDISSNLTMTQYENTQIVEVVFYWRDANEGTELLNAINSASGSILGETLNMGGVNVINAPSARYLVGGSLNAALCGALAILGLAAGLGIAVLELIMHPTLLNPRDLENNFGLEILGEVPNNNAYFNQNNSLLVRNNSYLDITESFSSMAHIIHNRAGSKEKHQRIYITSASRNEGKTMAVANLAIQLSDNEKKVLIIDFDLRNPQLGSFFLEKVEYDHSLNALYRGDINEVEAITPLTGYLDILPAVLERNTISLDSNISNLVKKLSENYDYVLMDTAPVGLSANILSLNEIATSALLVVRHDTASMQEIRDTLDRLDKSGVRLMGCIVNDVKLTESNNKRLKNANSHKKVSSDKVIANIQGSEDKYAASTIIGSDLADEAANQDAPKQNTVSSADDFANMLFQMYGGKEEEAEKTAEPTESQAPAAPEVSAAPEVPAAPVTEEAPAAPAHKSEKKSGFFGRNAKH